MPHMALYSKFTRDFVLTPLIISEIAGDVFPSRFQAAFNRIIFNHSVVGFHRYKFAF